MPSRSGCLGGLVVARANLDERDGLRAGCRLDEHARLADALDPRSNELPRRLDLALHREQLADDPPARPAFVDSGRLGEHRLAAAIASST